MKHIKNTINIKKKSKKYKYVQKKLYPPAPTPNPPRGPPHPPPRPRGAREPWRFCWSELLAGLASACWQPQAAPTARTVRARAHQLTDLWATPHAHACPRTQHALCRVRGAARGLPWAHGNLSPFDASYCCTTGSSPCRHASMRTRSVILISSVSAVACDPVCVPSPNRGSWSLLRGLANKIVRWIRSALDFGQEIILFLRVMLILWFRLGRHKI